MSWVVNGVKFSEVRTVSRAHRASVQGSSPSLSTGTVTGDGASAHVGPGTLWSHPARRDSYLRDARAFSSEPLLGVDGCVRPSMHLSPVRVRSQGLSSFPGHFHPLQSRRPSPTRRDPPTRYWVPVSLRFSRPGSSQGAGGGTESVVVCGRGFLSVSYRGDGGSGHHEHPTPEPGPRDPSPSVSPFGTPLR